MITQKMRQILIGELGFLPEEVNLMHPEVKKNYKISNSEFYECYLGQMARAAINRKLKRPSTGMLDSWMRDPTSKRPASDAVAYSKG